MIVLMWNYGLAFNVELFLVGKELESVCTFSREQSEQGFELFENEAKFARRYFSYALDLV